MANNKRKKRAKLDAIQKRPGKASTQVQSLVSSRKKKKQKQAPRRHPLQANRGTTIPFDKADDILLVGEGDFSFSSSLVRHHVGSFKSLTATAFDTREQLLDKYPQAEQAIELLQSAGQTASRSSPSDDSEADVQEDFPAESAEREGSVSKPACLVFYSVDATKLSSHPQLKRNRYSKIVFNFPHVGGKSTDVNRQVRYNQELVHGFLGSCQPLLKPEGSVLVTMFDGEPYTLWNVRDLARNVGLVVKGGFAFDAAAFPGYRHARTLGNIRGKDDADEAGEDKEAVGEKRAGWKGEERGARTYEFGLKQEAAEGSKKKRKKSGREVDDSSSDDEN